MAEDGGAALAGAPAESAAAREAAYRWLSGLLARPPDAGMLAIYGGAEGAAVLDALAVEPSLAPAAEALAARTRAQDRAAAALTLAGAFERLFSGQAGPRTASPYASVHTSARGLTHQAAMTEAARDLAAMEVHVAGLAEPPDHIAVLLAAMAELVRRNATAAAQAEFLDRHLLGWIGAFAEDCRAFDRDGLYAAVATATADYLRADHRRLTRDAR